MGGRDGPSSATPDRKPEAFFEPPIALRRVLNTGQSRQLTLSTIELERRVVHGRRHSMIRIRKKHFTTYGIGRTGGFLVALLSDDMTGSPATRKPPAVTMPRAKDCGSVDMFVTHSLSPRRFVRRSDAQPEI